MGECRYRYNALEILNYSCGKRNMRGASLLFLCFSHICGVRHRRGWDYPLHLGVTEAGEGEDGRMKSAIGIGALLMDGLGDTIRVSLTEDPEFELSPCSNLAEVRYRSSHVMHGGSIPGAMAFRHWLVVSTTTIVQTEERLLWFLL